MTSNKQLKELLERVASGAPCSRVVGAARNGSVHAGVGSGTHVTSVGFNPQGREVDADALASALVVVESRSAALAPYPAGSNDLLWAIRDGAFGPEHVHAEIGELVSGTRPGRTWYPARPSL